MTYIKCCRQRSFQMLHAQQWPTGLLHPMTTHVTHKVYGYCPCFCAICSKHVSQHSLQHSFCIAVLLSVLSWWSDYYYAVIATALQTVLKSSPQLWMHVISASHPSGLVFKNSCKCLKIAMNSLMLLFMFFLRLHNLWLLPALDSHEQFSCNCEYIYTYT